MTSLAQSSLSVASRGEGGASFRLASVHNIGLLASVAFKIGAKLVLHSICYSIRFNGPACAGQQMGIQILHSRLLTAWLAYTARPMV